MSISQQQNEHNLTERTQLQNQLTIITNRQFPYTNGYYNCPCGSAVKHIKPHLNRICHINYVNNDLIGEIQILTTRINLYERQQEERRQEEKRLEDEEDEALRRCHICDAEQISCSCADEYINYKSFHGENGFNQMAELDEHYNDEWIELYGDIKNVNMTDAEDIEEYVKNDDELNNLLENGGLLGVVDGLIDEDREVDIKNELVKSTTITPDICDIIAEYATDINYEDFYNLAIEDELIELTKEDVVNIDLCYYNKKLCLVFMTTMYRDNHYCYNVVDGVGYLYTLNYIGKDEYGNAKYERQSNRGMPVRDFTIMDYGYNHFTITYKDP